MSPGHNESGGKRKSGRTTHGNARLADALTEAAWAAGAHQGHLPGREVLAGCGTTSRRPAQEEGRLAVGHKILIAAYYIMAIDAEVYRDLGADHLATRDNPERHRDRLVERLAKLGYHVELTPAQPA